MENRHAIPLNRADEMLRQAPSIPRLEIHRVDLRDLLCSLALPF
jgi:hypothetical protein